MAYDIKAKFTKNSPLPCWKGYERVPGTAQGAKGSCRKSSPVKKYVSDAQRKAVWASKADGGKGRNFRTVEEGAGMTAKGVASYRAKNPGSNLQTAVTGDVKPGSKAAKRRKSFCARSKGWTGERGKAARRRWKC